jgi:AcrR family transcriptional regulator
MSRTSRVPLSTGKSEAAEPAEDLRLARGRSTRAQLIAAATDVLREHGYGATSLRAVADRAGVQLSLVHYHFGSKGGLLVTVLEELTRNLLERQQAMFAEDRPFAEQWRTACAYLREDVRSGYVRILWELWAAGLADPQLAERWRATQRGWKTVIEERLSRLETERGVELPMRPRVLTALIGNLFEGAEAEILAGVPEEETPHLEALDACAALIARAERKAKRAPRARRRRAR